MGNILKLHIGEKFGKLTVISDNYQKKKQGRKLRTFWLCRCECGSEKYYYGTRLRSGRTKACGCMAGSNPNSHTSYTQKYEFSSVIHKRTYWSWKGAENRCHSPNNPKYSDYGARGIKMCDRWRESFDNFFRDMGERPDGTSLGRINNDGDYEPFNCRWETRKEQDSNKRTTWFVRYKGEKIKLIDLCDRLHVDLNRVRQRLILGWSLPRALKNTASKSKTYKKRQVALNGVSYPISKFARLFGEYEKDVYRRLQSGWSLERTLGERLIIEVVAWGRLTPTPIHIPIPNELFKTK